MVERYVVLINNGFGWLLYSDEFYALDKAKEIAKCWSEQSQHFKSKVLQEVANY